MRDAIGQGLYPYVHEKDALPDAPERGGAELIGACDGRTMDLLQAIGEHKSSGSEANKVIEQFHKLSKQDQQDVLNFLRSL